jgi:hypothetical protein
MVAWTVKALLFGINAQDLLIWHKRNTWRVLTSDSQKIALSSLFEHLLLVLTRRTQNTKPHIDTTANTYLWGGVARQTPGWLICEFCQVNPNISCVAPLVAPLRTFEENYFEETLVNIGALGRTRTANPLIRRWVCVGYMGCWWSLKGWILCA